MRLGFLNFITLGFAGILQRAAILVFPIVTVILHLDTQSIKKVNNDIMQPDVKPAAPVDPSKPVTPAKPANN